MDEERFAAVTRTDAGGVTTLTLNRPEVHNALDSKVFDTLDAHLEVLSADTSVGCVVVTGAGASFSSGHDVAELVAGDAVERSAAHGAVIDRLEALPKPTIAKIRGNCLTGGLELALACDLLVAGESARLRDTHGRWGLVPVWGMSVRLPERVGRSTALRLMFTGEAIDGATAERLGLVDICVADEELDETVAGLAARIVANSWGTNRIVKALVTGAPASRLDALTRERSVPFGWPEDLANRMKAGRR
jgi:enoyl-CoA hydratase/carnithine racemase